MTNRTQQPPIQPFDNLSLQLPQPTTLPNGIPLYIVNGNENPICQLAFCFKAGKMYGQSPAQAIIAPMVAIEESENHNAKTIAERFDFYGAFKFTQTFGEYTQVSLTCLSRHLTHVLPILLDCFQHPTMPDNILNLQQRQIAANIQLKAQQVRTIAQLEANRLIYGDRHPLGQIIKPEHILQLSRHEIHSFFRNHYHPANCSIVAIGDINNQIRQAIERSVAQWNDNKTETPDCVWSTETSGQMLSIIDKPGAIQSAIILQLPAPNYQHPDFYPLLVLIYILGGHLHSRLNTNIREQHGYTYGIRAQIIGNQHLQYININTECDIKYTYPLLEQVHVEINRLLQQPINPNELNTVRQLMLADLARQLDTPFSRANLITEHIMFNQPINHFNLQAHAIQNTTPEQLRQLARQYLNPNLLRTVIATDKNRLKA